MTEWEPATDAEAAMRDALRANDQQLYFRVLARTELLLPVSAEALAGTAPAGWGTWTTGGRTHVLAFTSGAAVRACLGENGGAVRRTSYADLSAGWPNHEWWLAVNPGLPIEGYLPAWFVAQLSRGDVRLPGRTMGARARLERVETAARARAQAAGHGMPAGPDAGPATGVARPNGTLQPAPTAASSTGRVPAPAAPARPPAFPTEHLDPRRGDPTAGGPAQTDAVAAPERVPPPRPSPLSERPRGLPTPDAHPAPGTNGRPAGEAPERPNRSFFEPASGRAAAHRQEALRSGERAVPPSRLAAGSQPFPRRRPLGEPVPEEPTRPIPSTPTGAEPTHAFTTPAGEPTHAFTSPAGEPTHAFTSPAGEPTHAFTSPAGEPTHAFTSPAGEPTHAFTSPAGEPTHAFTSPAGEPTHAFTSPAAEPTHAFTTPAAEPTRAFAMPGGEATQVLPPRGPGEDATRDLRVSTPDPGPPPPGYGDRPQSSEDLTQALPRRQTTPEPVRPEPVAEAEPVSGPPAPRRGFTPIVIEGTIIESRDLNGRPAPEPAPPAEETVSLFEPVRRRREPVTAEPAPAASAHPSSPADTVRSAAPSWSGDATVSLDPTVSLDRTQPVVSSGDATVSLDQTVSLDPEPPTDAAWPGDATVSLDPAPSADAWSGDPTVPTSVAAPAPAADGGARQEAATDAGVSDVGPPVEDPGPTVADEPVTGTADGSPGPGAVPIDFQPANEVEENLLDAAGAGSTDTFLSTLLLARVLLPVAADSAPGSRPGEPGFVWRTQELDGETFVVVHTSPERLADHTDAAVETIEVRFVQLIRRWPDESWSFAVNPGTPVGAKLPGEQIVGLANWAAEVGLGDDIGVEAEPPPAAEEPASRPRYAPPTPDPARPIVMQKAVAPSQLAYYLERGYDRVSGFVHRAGELAHLTTPAQLHDALGLGYPESPFARDAGEIYVLRWPAHRPSLYRIPYGGQNEAAMRAMEGWVIERPPFRGNGFAPGESSDVVAEFKVDSARLPHGAQLWRIGADGTERVVAILDTDALRWRQVGEQ
ncbi:SseB family protein [Micromonospora sp. CPCC 205546]|uniref:SseB family protein n=1 Tax=Micromonospora sp. CPCC 205546 TaxID=3122397 RepID=UPI002FF0F462